MLLEEKKIKIQEKYLRIFETKYEKSHQIQVVLHEDFNILKNDLNERKEKIENQTKKATILLNKRHKTDDENEKLKSELGKLKALLEEQEDKLHEVDHIFEFSTEKIKQATSDYDNKRAIMFLIRNNSAEIAEISQTSIGQANVLKEEIDKKLKKLGSENIERGILFKFMSFLNPFSKAWKITQLEREQKNLTRISLVLNELEGKTLNQEKNITDKYENRALDIHEKYKGVKTEYLFPNDKKAKKAFDRLEVKDLQKKLEVKKL